MDLTTIPLKRETVRKLKRFGHKGETYDQLINRLLDERRMELVLPRRPQSADEVKRLMEEGNYVTREEAEERLGL